MILCRPFEDLTVAVPLIKTACRRPETPPVSEEGRPLPPGKIHHLPIRDFGEKGKGGAHPVIDRKNHRDRGPHSQAEAA